MTALRGWSRAAGSIRQPRPVLHMRAVAAATVASCLVHLWLVAGNHHGMWLNLLMLAMVGVCLPCAVHIWRDGRPGSLRQVMACALAMAALHAVLLLGAVPATGPAGHSHGVSGMPAAETAASAAGGMIGIIAMEITTALLAATLVARLRRTPWVVGP
ncbi:hypothetical protein JOE31_001003 [Arthrobacter sp. PvP023]|uniref:hypothetical protein n=1 Tax=Micrococcaceae TaxID=1268 RepID=UPI001AE6860E|nr:hypothetical protein [Arthrobacter sp. PvP023]MBP1134771.1 hypothetical protein [Arthrobacter sp. PvP023]